jgi:hypothetical protein
MEREAYHSVQHDGLLLPPMIPTLVIFQLVAASAAVPGQIDSICRDQCEILAVQEGTVRFIDQWPPTRNLDLGKYAPAAQRLVPRTEAPVRDLRSPRGWRVVASVYLDHDEDEILMHIRFFGPDGKLRTTSGVLSALEQTAIGNLFGGNDEVFAITSNEEHAYNAQTELWLLPERGDPKLLIEIQGVPQNFSGQAAGTVPGVMIARQTYDGVRSETKGTVQEFYAWEPKTKSLKKQ